MTWRRRKKGPNKKRRTISRGPGAERHRVRVRERWDGKAADFT